MPNYKATFTTYVEADNPTQAVNRAIAEMSFHLAEEIDTVQEVDEDGKPVGQIFEASDL